MNVLHYREEHVLCMNVAKEQNQSIEHVCLSAGKQWKRTLHENEVFFVLEGDFEISYDNIIGQRIHEGRAFVLLAGTRYKAYPKKNTSILIIRLKEELFFCGNQSLEKIAQEESDENYKKYPFEIGSKLTLFFDSLLVNLNDNIQCEFYFELKIKELLFLIGHYFTPKEILSLFHPLLSNNSKFSNFVLKNYKKARTVIQLAAMSPYSISGFEKEFNKVFGMSAYQWMTERRVRMLFHEINTTAKSLRQISNEYGFSPSQFNDYCKKHFGMPPGKMRQSGIILPQTPKNDDEQ